MGENSSLGDLQARLPESGDERYEMGLCATFGKDNNVGEPPKGGEWTNCDVDT